MEIRQLKYFLEIAQLRNYSMAAERLFISQPALSSSIKQLEREIGKPLFIYKKKTLSLTPAGMDLLNKARPFMEEYYNLIGSFQNEHNDLLTGRIRLGISSLLSNSSYIPKLVRFAEEYPKIYLAIKEEGSSDIHNMVSNNKIDIGLVVNPVETPMIGVTLLPPIKSKKYFLCRKNHPLSSSPSLTFDNLRNEKFIVLTERFSFTGDFLKECQANHFTPEIVLKCSSKSFITSAVESSDLVAILPGLFLNPSDYVNYHISYIKDSVEENISIGLIYKRGYNYKPGSVFLKYIEEN